MLKTNYALIAVTVTLAACGSKPSDGDYTDAVKTGLERQALCWNLPAVNGQFPSSIAPADYDPANEAKKAAVRAGVVTLVQQGGGYTVTLTDKGTAAHAWDAAKGNICIGHKELVGDVKILPGGDRGDGSDLKAVHYAWQLADVPQWVKDNPVASNALADQGLGNPVQTDSVVAREKKDGPLLLEEN